VDEDSNGTQLLTIGTRIGILFKKVGAYNKLQWSHAPCPQQAQDTFFRSSYGEAPSTSEARIAADCAAFSVTAQIFLMTHALF